MERLLCRNPNRSACWHATALSHLSLLHLFRHFPLKFSAIYLRVFCRNKPINYDTSLQVNNYSTISTLVSPASLFTHLRRQKRHLSCSCSEFPLRHINLRLAGLFVTSFFEQVGHTVNSHITEWRDRTLSQE
jgi:hypothetical protein